MRFGKYFSLIFALLALGIGARAAIAQASAADTELFEKRVRPILVEKCYRCHSATSSPIMGGLRLDSLAAALKGGAHGSAISPGHPEASMLVKAIKYGDSALQMPPTARMTDSQVQSLVEWIKRGAHWPAGAAVTIKTFDLRARAKHWAWQPITRPTPPVVHDRAWPRNPVDSFILAKLEAKGLKPAPETDRRTLIRRVTYDLIGLPPTPQEIAAFLADHSPNAYEKVVDRLLASPHYGERWARHWLDLVRYAETDGHEWDMEKTGAFQYRDYVIRAMNADVPYNQFVSEHIAGDLLTHPRRDPVTGNNESLLATGFYWLGAGQHSPVDLRDDEADHIDNEIDVLSKAFLGVGVACARCHDHKFDAISTKDYYALYGFLRSTRQQEAEVGPPIPTDVRSGLSQVETHIQALRRTAALDFLAPSVQMEWRDRAARTPPSDPADVLYPLSKLGKLDASAFVSTRDALIKQLTDLSDRSAHENKDIHWLTPFGDDDKYRGWSTTGDAFGGGPTSAASASIGKATLAFPAGAAIGGGVSERFHGALRSPTFVIDKAHLIYHVAGRNARVRVIIEGYQRIRDPIYGGLAIDVNSPDHATWMSQDLHLWIGQRAYVEFLTDGNGFIGVDRVGLTDNGPPSDAPNPLIVRLLRDPSITSAGTLERSYDRLFRSSASIETSGKSPVDGDEPARQDLMCAAIASAPVTSSETKQLEGLAAERTELEKRLPAVQPALAATDGTGADEHVHIRGNYRTPGADAPRRFLQACDWAAKAPPEPGSGRLYLASRMTSPTDPLLARVIVNRLWQHHFGEGIVRTPDDFGIMGQRPTHPELLDWLASELPRQGWSLKKMHRMMVLSSTYRMSSDQNAAAEKADPENKLLHRMPIRRLEAECIRDGILAVSGRLDPTLYGPPVMPHLSEFTPGRGAPSSGPVDGAGRRSIYLSIRRNFPIAMLTAFDYPVPVTTVGRRTVSYVPAQALALLNDPFVVEQADIWAGRVLAEPGTPEQRVDRIYESAFGRPTTAEERDAALAFVTDQSKPAGKLDDRHVWADLCHVMFNVKEFIFIH